MNEKPYTLEDLKSIRYGIGYCRYGIEEYRIIFNIHDISDIKCIERFDLHESYIYTRYWRNFGYENCSKDLLKKLRIAAKNFKRDLEKEIRGFKE